jgi:glycosidase
MRRKIILFLTLAVTLFATGSSCNPPVNPDTKEFKDVMTFPPQWDGTKRGDITYQLLVYSFADSDGDGWGDFRGITDKLDYIQSLGASAIWLSPIHPSASYHGYDVEDYSITNPRFGTMADFRQLVSEAHKRNIRIYLDYVINHSGVNHPWFKAATSSMDNPYRDIYMVGEVFSDWDRVAPYYKGLPALFDFSFWWRMNADINQGLGLNFADATISTHETFRSHRSDYIAATKLSNHDENRARSELGGLLSKAKLAGAMLLSSQGSPYIYYGEELGYTGTKSGGDEYVRTPMYWGDHYVTSYTTKIDPAVEAAVGSVVSQEADASSILTMYRQLGRLRNSCPALATGKMERHPVINPKTGGIYSQVAAWYMIEGNQKLLVLHNLGQSEIIISLSDSLDKPLFANGRVQSKKEKEHFQLKMEGYSSAIFEL